MAGRAWCRGFAFTALSSTAVIPVLSSVAPAGIRVVVTVLPSSRTGVDRDTAGIDALLLDQVVLRVDSALQRRASLPCFSVLGSVADERELRIRRALQVQGDIVKASLAFVVDPGRTALVTLEVDRAECCWS